MRYACDFETTVYDGQESTEVWLAGYVSEDYQQKCIVKSIRDFIFFFIVVGGWLHTVFPQRKI